MRHAIAWVLASCILLVACTQQETAQTAGQTAVNPLVRAGSLEPSDEHLASLYQQSCRSCHSLGAAGAPLTGDRAAWDARWQKGMVALRSSTISGLNGMPPGGQCFACSVQDYEALIAFMAGRGPAKE